MVLNGKAELIEKSFGATIIRNERVELCAIVTMLAASTVVSIWLYYCMEDGWQTNTQLRWKVFTLSISLLVLSVVACLYLCRRHRPSVYLNSTRERSLESVNSHHVLLLSGEQPPNYNSVKPKHLLSGEQSPNYHAVKPKHLLSGEQPPNYNAVKPKHLLVSGEQPPNYNAVKPKHLLVSGEQPPNYNAVKPKHLLVSGEQPPNYNAVKQTLSMFTSSKTDYLLPPPIYNAVFNV